MKPVVHFFAIGALLFAGKLALAHLGPRPKPTLEVSVPAGADASQVSTRIDEAVLVTEALRFGWARRDPVVRRRLALNMAVARGSRMPENDAQIDDATVREAFSLRMHETDPLVRGRLALRMRELLATPLPEDRPSDTALLEYAIAHRSRYERPAHLGFVQIPLLRDRHGLALSTDAEKLLRALRDGGMDVGAARALGDPAPLLPGTMSDSPATVDRRFGPGFADAVGALTPGEWGGPIASAYGLHIVRAESRSPARLPDLPEIRPRVLDDFLSEHAPSRVSKRLAELRARYDVRVQQGPEVRP